VYLSLKYKSLSLKYKSAHWVYLKGEEEEEEEEEEESLFRADTVN